MIYQTLKVIHIISMLVWSSGMFRLFDYYQNASGREAERDGGLSFDCRWTTPAIRKSVARSAFGMKVSPMRVQAPKDACGPHRCPSDAASFPKVRVLLEISR